MVFSENKPSAKPFFFYIFKEIMLFFNYNYAYFLYLRSVFAFSKSITAPNLIFRKQSVEEIVNNGKNISIIVGFCSSIRDMECYYDSPNNSSQIKCIDDVKDIPIDLDFFDCKGDLYHRYSFEYQNITNIQYIYIYWCK
jgi:hypothetical protein